jgi:hypothetical protein
VVAAQKATTLEAMASGVVLGAKVVEELIIQRCLWQPGDIGTGDTFDWMPGRFF